MQTHPRVIDGSGAGLSSGTLRGTSLGFEAPAGPPPDDITTEAPTSPPVEAKSGDKSKSSSEEKAKAESDEKKKAAAKLASGAAVPGIAHAKVEIKENKNDKPDKKSDSKTTGPKDVSTEKVFDVV